MKKTISLFTTLCIVFSILSTFTVLAQDSAADITEISTLAELEAFRDDVNSGNTYEGKTVKLTADIDMSEKYGADINGEEISWSPIGTEEQPFNGIFYGRGHIISGLYINSRNTNSGLFGHTDNKSIIKNLTVGGCMNVNTDTNKSQYAGAIAGHNQGIIESCNNEASVNAIEALNGGIISGGIAGFNNGIIRKCTNSGMISTKTYLVGGICGRNFGLVENCFNAGDVSGKYLIGGLCAQLMYSGRISNCFNIGSVDGEDCVGDMVGDDRIQVIDNVYYFMTYKPDETTSDIGTAKTAEQFASGEVAYLLGDEWGQNIGVDEYPVIGGDKVYLVNNTYTNTAPNTETNITEISTLAELEAFRDDVNNGNTYEGKTVKLIADIDMSNKYGEGKESWTPISNSYDKVFSGTFDGNTHTINNLYINIPEYAGVDDYGLFGFIDGTLKNLNVNGSVICYSDRVAGIVASVGENGAVINCSFDGTVKGNTFVGGIATFVKGLISDCHCSGTVDGVHMVGGIVCNVSNASDLENKGILENCTNESTVTAGSMAGGIVGALNIYAKVTGCVNKGEVKGVASEYEDAEIIGGIAGTNEISIVENCYNTGLVLGNQKIGGITGIASGPYSDYYTNKLAVKNCYNIGNVTATGTEPTDTVGGVVGEIGEGATNNDITNCYYLDTCISGEQTVSASLTAEQFADKSNFTNWDFDTVWEMDENLGRPVLRSGREEPPVHTHTLIHHAAADATCTEMGNREYWQCSDCGNVFEDEEATREIDGIPTIDATGHTEVTDTAVEPTCETDGKTAGSHCSVCNTIITAQTIIPKLNHEWGDWTITTEPAFNSEGKAERVCKTDSTHKEIIDLPALSDSTVWEVGLRVEPTEIFDGFIQYTSQYGTVSRIINALSDKHFLIEYFNSTATVSSRDAGTYLVIFAEYDINGALVNVDCKDVTFETAGVQEVTSEKLNSNVANTVKVMLWDSLMGMKPLCAADGN